MIDLPYAADAESEISTAELEVLEDAYKRASLSSRGQAPPQIKFNYAWGLVRSKYREDQKKGVELFREIYRDDGERGRECVYYLALGYYRLGDLPMSRKFNDILLKSEPDNMQARSLSSLIDKRLNRDGLLGVALVGGAVAVGVFLALLLRKK